MRAQDRYVEGKFDNAKGHAREAMAQDPNKAWRIIGASECSLKTSAAALEAANHLEASGRQFLKYVCSRNNVTLP